MIASDKHISDQEVIGDRRILLKEEQAGAVAHLVSHTIDRSPKAWNHTFILGDFHILRISEYDQLRVFVRERILRPCAILEGQWQHAAEKLHFGKDKLVEQLTLGRIARFVLQNDQSDILAKRNDIAIVIAGRVR